MKAGVACASPVQIETGGGIGDQRVVRSLEAGDDSVAGAVSEVHEEAQARNVVRRERHSEQALLSPEGDGAAQIEKICREHGAILDSADVSVLLDDILD